MSISQSNFDLESVVRDTTITAIRSYLEKVKQPKSQHVVLDRIFPTERYVRSIMGGLETSLGTKLWETLAKAIAKANNFTILNEKTFQKPKAMPEAVSQLISVWHEQRMIPQAYLSLDEYIQALQDMCQQLDTNKLTFTTVSSGDGIDLWLEKNEEEYIFDIKTVQINAGYGNSFSAKVMSWYAYRFLQDATINLKAAIAFPYSPFPPYTVNSWWAKLGSRAYPLKRNEDALVQDEFWNFLSGQGNTWARILSVFDNIGQSDFATEYQKFFYPNKID